MDIYTVKHKDVVKFSTSLDSVSESIQHIYHKGNFDFADINLSEQALDNLSIFNSIFSYSDMSNSTFKNCNFSKCKFTKTDFKYSIFENCVFSECSFVGADFSSTKFNNTILEGTLENAKGLCEFTDIKKIYKFNIACNPTSDKINLGCWCNSADWYRQTTAKDYSKFITKEKYIALRDRLDEFLDDYENHYNSKFV